MQEPIETRHLLRGNRMPHKTWKHFCVESQTTVEIVTEVCADCGKLGEYAGWHYSRIERMWAYQQRTHLKPIGPHRRLADRLIDRRMGACKFCQSKGLLDVNNGEGWEGCPWCASSGYVFNGSEEELESLRRQVLSAFPDAAVSNFSRRLPTHRLKGE